MRRAPLVSALLLAASAGCPTPAPRPTDPHPAPVDAAMPPSDDAAVAEAAAPAPLAEDECVRFIDHTLAVGMAEQRASKPADYVPTDEQVAAIRAKLIASKPCAELTRPQWECALAAATRDALYRCAQ